jgi:hypothetical protein
MLLLAMFTFLVAGAPSAWAFDGKKCDYLAEPDQGPCLGFELTFMPHAHHDATWTTRPALAPSLYPYLYRWFGLIAAGKGCPAGYWCSAEYHPKQDRRTPSLTLCDWGRPRRPETIEDIEAYFAAENERDEPDTGEQFRVCVYRRDRDNKTDTAPWYYVVGMDGPAIEVNTFPMNARSTRFRAAEVQSIFDVASALELHPHPFFAGGHIHIDVGSWPSRSSAPGGTSRTRTARRPGS